MAIKRVSTTITEHLLREQGSNPEATAAFIHLLNELIVTAVIKMWNWPRNLSVANER